MAFVTKNKKVYEVEIAGTPLKLLSEHPEELVHEMVEFVDQKVCQALPFTKNESLQSAALLAALNIAEDLFLLKQNAQIELDRIADRTEMVLSQLESSNEEKA